MIWPAITIVAPFREKIATFRIIHAVSIRFVLPTKVIITDMLCEKRLPDKLTDKHMLSSNSNTNKSSNNNSVYFNLVFMTQKWDTCPHLSGNTAKQKN